MMAGSESLRWSATHRLPNANAAVKPAPGSRPECTSLEHHYRIDINTIPPTVDEQQRQLQITGPGGETANIHAARSPAL